MTAQEEILAEQRALDPELAGVPDHTLAALFEDLIEERAFATVWEWATTTPGYAQGRFDRDQLLRGYRVNPELELAAIAVLEMQRVRA